MTFAIHRALAMAACCLLLSSISWGQGTGITYGIRAGINSSTVVVSRDDQVPANTSSRLGWTAGAFMKIPVVRQILLQPEVVVATMGATMSPSQSHALGDERIALTYLELPVHVRYEFTGLGGSLIPYLQAGPTVAVVLRARDTTTHNGQTRDLDIKDGMTSPDVRVSFGGGVRTRGIDIDLRYQVGVRNIFPRDAGGSAKNRLFSLTAGIRF